MKKLTIYPILMLIAFTFFYGCSDKNSREYTLSDSVETKPAAPAPAPVEEATGDGLTLTIKGEMFKDGKHTLKPLSASYSDADGVTVLMFKGMLDKDSAQVEITFTGDKAGKFEVGKMSGKGNGKNGFTISGWIPGADPASKYLFLSNMGHIEISETGSVIKGTVKGGGTDIRAETPSDLTLEGSFTIQKK